MLMLRPPIFANSRQFQPIPAKPDQLEPVRSQFAANLRQVSPGFADFCQVPTPLSSYKVLIYLKNILACHFALSSAHRAINASENRTAPANRGDLFLSPRHEHFKNISVQAPS
jgi:hypothetical protein